MRTAIPAKSLILSRMQCEKCQQNRNCKKPFGVNSQATSNAEHARNAHSIRASRDRVIIGPSAGGRLAGSLTKWRMKMTDFQWSRPGMSTRTGAEATSGPQGSSRAVRSDRQTVRPGRLYGAIPQEPVMRHWGESKRIDAPRPVTRKALYIFLHECAHAHLHVDRKPKAHVREMEAEMWAHARMREHGIAVPRAMTARAKRYVARKIVQAKRCGAKSIDRKAAQYAK